MTSRRPDTSVYEIPTYFRNGAFWGRPQRQKEGNSDAGHIYVGVGDVLSAWEWLENSFSVLFKVLVESQTIAAERAYGTINGARGRADALTQAGQIFFQIRSLTAEQRDRNLVVSIQKTEKIFNTIVDNYGRAATRRNDIAHGIAYNLTDFEKTPRNYYLVAPLYQSKNQKNWLREDIRLRATKGTTLIAAAGTDRFSSIYFKNSEYAYVSSDLKVIADKLRIFTGDVDKFTNFLAPGTLPEFNTKAPMGRNNGGDVGNNPIKGE